MLQNYISKHSFPDAFFPTSHFSGYEPVPIDPYAVPTMVDASRVISFSGTDYNTPTLFYSFFGYHEGFNARGDIAVGVSGNFITDGYMMPYVFAIESDTQLTKDQLTAIFDADSPKAAIRFSLYPIECSSGSDLVSFKDCVSVRVPSEGRFLYTGLALLTRPRTNAQNSFIHGISGFSLVLSERPIFQAGK